MMNRFANLRSSFAIILNEFLEDWKYPMTQFTILPNFITATILLVRLHLYINMINRFCCCARVHLNLSFTQNGPQILPVLVCSSEIYKRVDLHNFPFPDLLLHFGVVNFAVG